MDTRLYIDIPANHYLPGSTIEGKVLWVLDSEAREVRISLGWWTEGRGSKDAKIEDETVWETMEPAGERSFSFKLPASPYSFDGKLISLKWGLELTARGTKEKALQDIVVSPMESPIALGTAEDESSRKSFPGIRD